MLGKRLMVLVVEVLDAEGRGGGSNKGHLLSISSS